MIYTLSEQVKYTGVENRPGLTARRGQKKVVSRFANRYTCNLRRPMWHSPH
jgi:hypothetical protein